jgi:NAD(P)-dependent dehydrogenase (short-subunit alcohol dehydrogenase family)
MSEPMNSHGPLVGRVAVVTDASRRAGIGYALARLAAAPSCTR